MVQRTGAGHGDDGYFAFDVESPYNTESESTLADNYALLTFKTRVWSPFKENIYVGLLTFNISGGGTVDARGKDTTLNHSNTSPRLTTNPFWETNGYLGLVVWNDPTWTNRRIVQYDWTVPKWLSAGNWLPSPMPQHLYGDVDITIPISESEDYPLLAANSFGWNGKRSSAETAEFPITQTFQWNDLYTGGILPVLVAEKGNAPYNLPLYSTIKRVFALWYQGPNLPDLYRARRVGGIQVKSLEAPTPQTLIGVGEKRVFTFEIREGMADILFARFHLRTVLDSINGKVSAVKLYLDRNQDGAWDSSIDPVIASSTIPPPGGADLIFDVNGYFTASPSPSAFDDKATFFITYYFAPPPEVLSANVQLSLFPGYNTTFGYDGIKAQLRPQFYSPETNDTFVSDVEGSRTSVLSQTYHWQRNP